MINRYFSSASKAALAAAAVFAAPMPAIAQQAQYQFDIPAQGLDSALKRFGRITHLQLVYDGAKARSARSSAVVGRLTSAEALAHLLAGSGFSMHVGRSGVYIIEPTGIARNDRDGLIDETASNDQRGEADILVIGRRTLNADVRRSKDDAQPYVIISGQDVQNSGAINVEDYLKSRLPMNTQVGGTNQPQFAGAGGATNRGGITLRGLSTAQTLILVNGRRVPGIGFASADGSGQPNINGIPPSSIERIEVLPATAGGIYGGGAVGGVINIILKQDYRGLDLEATYGSPFDRRVPYAAISANGGFSLEGGRTLVTIRGSYSRQGELDGSDRNFQKQGRELDFRNLPADFTTPPYGSVTNVCSLVSNLCSPTAPNLVLKSGASLNSPYTTLPAGSGGANRFDLSTPKRFYSLYSGPELQSYGLSVRRTFNKWLEGFLDVGLNRTKSTNTTVPTYSLVVPSADPSNPFLQPVRVGLVISDSPRTITAKVSNKNVNVGAITHFGLWSAALEHNWSQSVNSIDLEGDLNVFPAESYLRSRLFTNTPITRADLIANGAAPARQIFGPFKDTLNDSTFRLSGKVFKLPGGSATFSGYLERRDERLGAASSLLASSFTSVTYYAPKRQEVLSAYGEVRLPLISAKQAIPFLRELELFGALRHDDYRTYTSSNGGVGSLFSPTTTPPTGTVGPFTPIRDRIASTDFTVGAKFAPAKDLTFRASYGTSFLPPSLGQLFGSTFPLNGGSISDPKRGNTPLGTSISAISGGNTNLSPERAKSLSVGAILSPGFIPKLRISVDYTRIRKSDEITTVPGGYAGLLAYENLFPERVTRAPLTVADQALGYTGGVVTALDGTLINIAGARIQAIDFQIDYEIDTRNLGIFRPSLIATRQTTFARQIVAGSPFLNTVGYNDGPLTWGGVGGITWEKGHWNIGWNAQYFASHRICNSFDSSATCAASVQRQGSTRIPRQFYNDFFVRFNLGNSSGRTLLSGVALSLGIQNAFNAKPPIIATFGGPGYDLRGDPRLRRFTFTLRKHFGR